MRARPRTEEQAGTRGLSCTAKPLKWTKKNAMHANTPVSVLSDGAPLGSLLPPQPPGTVALPSSDVQAVMLFMRPGHLEAKHSLRVEGLAASLLSLAPRREVATDEVVWRPEDEASSFLIVLSGSLELMYDGVHVELLVPGSSCGFLFMFARGKRDTLMVGSSASVVLVISRNLFESMHESHPSLQHQLREGMMVRVATEYQHYVRHHVVTHTSTPPPPGSRMQ